MSEKMLRAAPSAAVAAILLMASVAWAGINIPTVPVGDVGNAADTTGFGRVDYAYNIGKYEVTAGQYTGFLNAVGGVDTYGLYITYMSRTTEGGGGSGITQSGGGTAGNPFTYSVATDFVNRPVNLVSWGDSARFTNWLNNGQPTGAQNASTTEDGAYYLNGATSREALMAVSRKADWKWAITSEDEWYKAAYYKGGGTNAGYWLYPTRSNTVQGRDMADVSGNNANYYYGSGAYPIDSGKYTTVVGEFENSASPCGTFDQGGNVYEWNESIISGSRRGLRGGSFYYGYKLRADDRSNSFPEFESNGLGFRVSQVPEPASIGVLALCGIGMLVRRRGVGR
jgi:formylglycine-generating enzyme required for sulfatase activity